MKKNLLEVVAWAKAIRRAKAVVARVKEPRERVVASLPGKIVPVALIHTHFLVHLILNYYYSYYYVF